MAAPGPACLDGTSRVKKPDDWPGRRLRHEVELVAEVHYPDGHRAEALISNLSLEGCRMQGWYRIGDVLDTDEISEHLYTAGQPDPDLIIRTSGEQRLSGFLMWQSAHSEFYFCEALWPDFRKIDFIRALRSYAQRERRYGH